MNLNKQDGTTEEIAVVVEVPSIVFVILAIIIIELGAILYSLYQHHIDAKVVVDQISMMSEHTHDVVFDKDIVITFDDGLVGKIQDVINE
jgi:hypothetical protein